MCTTPGNTSTPEERDSKSSENDEGTTEKKETVQQKSSENNGGITEKKETVQQKSSENNGGITEKKETVQQKSSEYNGGITEKKETVQQKSSENNGGITEKKETVQQTVIEVESPKNESSKNDASPQDRVSEDTNKRSYLSRVSIFITSALEDKFEAHGRRVASHPRTTAALCLVISALCGLGCLNFFTELRPYRLWIPQNSEFIKVMNWQTENFPSSYRRQMAIWEADNVLTARVIQEMFKLHNTVKDIKVGANGTSWSDICAPVPSIPMKVESEPEEVVDYEDFDYGSLLLRRRRSTEEEEDVDLSLVLPRDQYCRTLESLPSMCLETSLLEIWGLDEDAIMNLTDEQVIEDFNHAELSRVFGFQVNFTKYLGSVSRDEAGRVISAKAAMHAWVTLVDELAISKGEFIVDQGSGEAVDTTGMIWEKTWVQTILEDYSRPKDIALYAHAASSFGDISDKNIWGDVKWLMVGICVMISFVNMTLGKRDLVQQRPLLAFMGLFSVAQAVAIAYGLCSLLNIPYNPVNSILPILLIGLGVDDMFVIMSAWEAAGRHKSATTDLVERAGKTMRHAGVAITVTSLTDVTAFAVGASTELPALRSFCAYAAVGIFAVYALQATFFLVWVVRDEKRMQENRNGLLWCIVHHEWKPWSCSQRPLMEEAFKKFCKFLLCTPVRVLILILTGALMAISIWTTSNLHQEFNPMWFIPNDSYLYKSFEASMQHFPENGEKGYVYFANISLPEDLEELNNFVGNLTASGVVTDVNAWFTALDDYLSQIPEIDRSTLDYSLLQDKLSLFLQSSSGASYQRDFTVNGQLDCRSPAPPVTSFRISITHKPAPTPKEQAHALETIKSLVAGVPVQGYKAAWAQAYSIWETNEVVGIELWRNMLLAAAVVFIVTLILLASFWGSVLVLVCVASTVAGVGGAMWLWSLTVDTVSCIALVLSIGLSVDYAAHIAHAFLAARTTNDKKKRAFMALEGVGPAVLQGGVSTLLAFVLLAWSTSHVFITFFKVFTAASILGLYYGLVFLPVVLSFIGPAPYECETAKTSKTSMEDDANRDTCKDPKGISNQAYTSDVV